MKVVPKILCDQLEKSFTMTIRFLEIMNTTRETIKQPIPGTMSSQPAYLQQQINKMNEMNEKKGIKWMKRMKWVNYLII